MSPSGSAPERPFVSSDLTVDFVTKQVQVRGRPVRLTNTEYELLCCLVRNVGRSLSTSLLLSKVWGPEYGDVPSHQELRHDPRDPEGILLVPVGGHQAESKKYLLKVCIQHLRQKIELDPHNPKMVITERGVGYKFLSAA